MTDVSPILALIKDAKVQLAKLDEKAVVLRTQIDAFEKTLKAMGGVSVDESRIASKIKVNVTRTGRKRPLDPKWAEALDFIGTFELGVNSDEIFTFMARSNPEITRDRLRSQLHNYSNAGILQRVANGVFQITPAGTKALADTKQAEIDSLI